MLCVTHLPQVAAFADAHYMVAKQTSDMRSEARITALSAAARLDELAGMLAGTVTHAARQSAQELMERAAAVKATTASAPRKRKLVT